MTNYIGRKECERCEDFFVSGKKLICLECKKVRADIIPNKSPKAINVPAKESWERDFVNKYSPMFQEIADMADKGDDTGYGKGLARLEIEITEYIRKLLSEERQSTIARCAEEARSYDRPWTADQILRIREDIATAITSLNKPI